MPPSAHLRANRGHPSRPLAATTVLNANNSRACGGNDDGRGLYRGGGRRLGPRWLFRNATLYCDLPIWGWITLMLTLATVVILTCYLFAAPILAQSIEQYKHQNQHQHQQLASDHYCSEPRPQQQQHPKTRSRPSDRELDAILETGCSLLRRAGEHTCRPWARIDLLEIVETYDVRREAQLEDKSGPGPRSGSSASSSSSSSSFADRVKYDSFPPWWGSEKTCAACKRHEHYMHAAAAAAAKDNNGGDPPNDHLVHLLHDNRHNIESKSLSCPTRHLPLPLGMWEMLEAFLGNHRSRSLYFRYFGPLSTVEAGHDESESEGEGEVEVEESEYEREDRKSRTRRVEERCRPYWYEAVMDVIISDGNDCEEGQP